MTVAAGGEPEGRIVTLPPRLVIEVLFQAGRAEELLERMDDCLSFGLPDVWVLHPGTRRGWSYTAEGAREAR